MIWELVKLELSLGICESTEHDFVQTTPTSFFLTQQSSDSCTLIAVGVWRFLINFDHLLIDYFRESKLVLHLILQTQSLKDQNLFSASSQHIIARFTWLWTVEPSSAFQEGVCGRVWPSALHEQLLRYRFSFSSFFFLFKCQLSCANIIKLPESLSALIQLLFHLSEIVLAHDSKVLFQTCHIADAVRGKMAGSFKGDCPVLIL